MVGRVWEAEGRADARAGGRISLQSPLVFLPPRPPTSWQLTGPVRSRNTDGRAGDPVRRRSTAHEDDAVAVL